MRIERRHTVVAATCATVALAGCASQSSHQPKTAALTGLRTPQEQRLLTLIKTARSDARSGDVAGMTVALQRFRTEVDALHAGHQISGTLADWLSQQATAAETQGESLKSTRATGTKHLLASINTKVEHAKRAAPRTSSRHASGGSTTAAQPGSSGVTSEAISYTGPANQAATSPKTQAPTKTLVHDPGPHDRHHHVNLTGPRWWSKHDHRATDPAPGEHAQHRPASHHRPAPPNSPPSTHGYASPAGGDTHHSQPPRQRSASHGQPPEGHWNGGYGR